MQKKTKVLVSSLATIALSASLATGATYALFTSESKLNIAINAGEVEIVATMDENPILSSTLGENLPETSATVSENKLTVTNMVAGDQVDFNITVSNKSTVSVWYRSICAMESGQELFNDLEVYFDGALYNGATRYSDWEKIEPNSADITVPVRIYLPEEAEGKYEDRTCALSFSVEAIQGNAKVTNPDAVISGGNTSEADPLQEAIANGATNIYLEDGTYTIPSNAAGKSINIVGNGETAIDATKAIGLSGATLNFENVNIEGIVKDYVGYQHTEKVTYKNCTINNQITLYANTVEFEGCTFTGNNYVWTYSADNVLFNNCTFKKSNGRSILVYQEKDTEVCKVTVSNCSFEATEKGTTSSGAWVAAVEIDSSYAPAEVTIENCTYTDAYNGIVRHKAGSNAVIKVDGEYLVDADAILANVLTRNEKEIKVKLTKDLNLDVKFSYILGGKDTEEITIDGEDNRWTWTTTYQTSIGMANPEGKLILKNMQLNGTGNSATTWNIYDLHFECDVEMYDVECLKEVSIAAGVKAVFNNVTIKGTDDYYALWIIAGADVTLNNVTIDTKGRAIKICDQYVDDPQSTTLVINGGSFTFAKKAAVLVGSKADVNITISGLDCANTGDKTNAVWVDKDYSDNSGKVTVSGAEYIFEA